MKVHKKIKKMEEESYRENNNIVNMNDYLFGGVNRFIIYCFVMIIFLSLMMIGGVVALGDVNHQYKPSYNSIYSPADVNTYWPVLTEDPKSCFARKDLILQIIPGSCQPAVVRSDLLAERNVPVFCQVSAVQINPLIDIEEIRNIRFVGQYPKDVVGIGFHPSRAALNSRDRLLGDPVINNIGYVVIILRQNERESELPDFVHLNLSARIEYNAGNSLGVGKAEFVLEEDSNGKGAGFWEGRYSIRADEIGADAITVSIYNGDQKIVTQRIGKGKLSEEIFVSGLYCRAGLQVAFDDVILAEDKAIIEVTSDDGTDVFDVYDDSGFLSDRCKVTNLEIEDDGSGKVRISCRGESSFILEKKLIQEGERCSNSAFDSGGEEFDDAIDAYKKVGIEFPQEDPAANLKYGEEAYSAAIKLAKHFNQHETARKLYDEMLKIYPNSDFKFGLALNNECGASKIIELDGRIRVITLKDLEKPKDEKSVEIVIGGQLFNGVKEGEKRQDDNLEVTVNKIEPDEIRVSYECVGEDGKNIVRNSKRVKLGESISTDCEDGSAIKFSDADLASVAKVRVLPKAQKTGSEIPLFVSIGIEKRAIKLSPERTRDLINNLNESIEDWENLNENLGDVVEGFNAACLATGAALTATNLLTGLSGEALARKQVMKEEWTPRCVRETSGGGENGDFGGSMSKCFGFYSDDIGIAVEKRTKVIGNVNDIFEEIEKGHTRDGGFLGQDYINQGGVEEDLLKGLRGESVGGVSVDLLSELKDFGSCKVKVGDLDNNLDVWLDGVESDDISIGQLNEILTYCGDGSSDALEQVGEIIESVNRNKALRERTEDAEGETGELGIERGNWIHLSGVGREASVPEIREASANDKDLLTNVGGTTHVTEVIVGPGKYNTPGGGISQIVTGSYVLGLSIIPGSVPAQYRIEGVSGGVTKEQFQDAYGVSVVKKSLSFNNKINDPKVQYYEVEPYKGMAAVVPLAPHDDEGWYVGVRQTLPVFGGKEAYKVSGLANSFWVCNVGSDNTIDFLTGGGKDEGCVLFNADTGQSTLIGGVDKAKADRLINDAIKALNDANRQYGSKFVIINGKRFEVGLPATNVPETQCESFMSPTECRLLYNVCDPVVCPASRCNLGGNYHVPNVIQTGVIGGAVMCLPNFPEVIVPICLSGVHAGLDSYVSVMKAHQQCLQEALETGRSVGICDQIHSVYLCDLFWKQAQPLTEVAVPKLFELVKGESKPRGGGEYAVIQSSWENAKESVDFFTQEYAVNSFEAFQARNIEQVGSADFCQVFTSISAPEGFDSLIEPASPPQVYAWFSSTRFSDVTVPPTSQYKAFYHIFAGKDSGVQYSVYLKGAPESSFYNIPNTVFVPRGTGFVPRGQFVSESVDFTAPEGYGELCVRVNGIEQCGFGQVTTDFALNFLKDKLVQNELTQTGIASEVGCVSGRPSLAGVATPNLQSGAESLLNPDVSKRGIVRICAQENPGLGTDETRFTNVGHCGDENIICWLDEDSVENAISDANKGIVGETLEELEKHNNKALEPGLDDVGKEIGALNKKVNSLKGRDSEKSIALLKEIDTVFEMRITNSQKAKLLLLKAQVLGKVVLAGGSVKVSNIAGDEVGSEEEESDREIEKVDEVTDINRDGNAPKIPQVEERQYLLNEDRIIYQKDDGETIDSGLILSDGDLYFDGCDDAVANYSASVKVFVVDYEVCELSDVSWEVLSDIEFRGLTVSDFSLIVEEV